MTAEEFLDTIIKKKQGKLSSIIWKCSAVDAMEEYSNLKNRELQEELDKVKKENEELIVSSMFQKAEHGGRKIRYEKLKSAADEMAIMLSRLVNGKQATFAEMGEAVSQYKQLTKE